MPKLLSTDPACIAERIRWRDRGGAPRAYGEFRDFADVGGGQIALKLAGERFATADPDVARQLAVGLLAAFQGRRALRPTAPAGVRTLGAYADHHLAEKADEADVTPEWLGEVRVHLAAARAFLGERRDLADVLPADITRYDKHLRTLPNGRGGCLATGTTAPYVNSLSNLFGRAISEGVVPMGHNPVAARLHEGKVTRKKTLWLELDEAAAVLAAARDLERRRPDLAIPFVYEIVATIMLTRARLKEVLGLRRDDVSFEQKVVVVHENPWRRVKTEGANRTVPLFPHLERILRAYLAGPRAPAGDLLFPGFGPDGEERLITDLRKAFDQLPAPARFTRPLTKAELARAVDRRKADVDRAIARATRWRERNGLAGPLSERQRRTIERLAAAPLSLTYTPAIRSRMLRHTWCAARIQTTVQGKAIGLFEVALELGHTDLKMITRVYGHLQKLPSRGEHVEYLCEV